MARKTPYTPPRLRLLMPLEDAESRVSERIQRGELIQTSQSSPAGPSNLLGEELREVGRFYRPTVTGNLLI
jgi:hypothetical protein